MMTLIDCFMQPWESLLGIPHPYFKQEEGALSCCGLVNLVYSHISGTGKWSRCIRGKRVQKYESRYGDVIVWYSYTEEVVPCHVGIVIKPPSLILHSGYLQLNNGLSDEARVHIHDSSMLQSGYMQDDWWFQFYRLF